MQPRQAIYQVHGGVSGVRTPQPVQVQAGPVDGTAGKVVAHLDDFMRQAGPALGRAYMAQQTARVDDAVMLAQQKFDAYQAEYQRTRQGAEGLTAAQDYALAFEEIKKEALKEFDGAEHEVFAGMLEQRLGERARQAAGQGLAWQARQAEIWQQTQWQGQQDEYYRRVADNPEDVETMLVEKQNLKDSLRLKNPGKDLTAEFNKIDEQTLLSMAEGRLAKGDTAGVRALLASPLAKTGGQVRPLGEAVSQFESGSDGIMAVGYDKNGGTSYGVYQLSSRQGSLEEWHKHLAASGPKGAAIARELAAAGNADTGSREGKYVEVYKRLARENPELFARTQRESIIRNNYNTAVSLLKKSAPGLLQMVEADPALQEMLFSTAVQHGGAGAAKILGKVFTPGMSREDLVAATYNERGNHFQSSSPEVRRAVLNRYRDEQQVVLGIGKERSVLGPRQTENLLSRCAALERQRQATVTAGMQEQINNYVNASQDGHIQEIPFTREQIGQAFGERSEQVWAELEGARSLALDMHSARTMNPAEMASLAQARLPAPDSPHYSIEARNHERLERQLGIMQKQMAEDPAAYALAMDEGARQARASFFARMTPESCQQFLAATKGAMESRGIGGRLLAKQDAVALGAMLNSSPDPVPLARQMAQCFQGSFPQALKEISGSLAPAVMLAATGMEAEPGRQLIRAARDKDFEKNILKLRPDIVRKDFDERVNKELEELNSTFMAGRNSEMPLALVNGVSLLALSRMMQNPELKEKHAIEQAYKDIIGQRYELHHPRASAAPCRIPKLGVDIENAKRGLQHFLDVPPIDNLRVATLPGTNQQIMGEALASHLRRNGCWVTDEDEGGAVLFVGTQAVAGTDGKPFRLTWQQLEAIGRQRRREMEIATQTGGAGQGW